MAIVNPYLKKKKSTKPLSNGSAKKNDVQETTFKSMNPNHAKGSVCHSNSNKTKTTDDITNVDVQKSKIPTDKRPNVAFNTLNVNRSKISVKQRLKHEIAFLKKQKQLQKLQKETEERRNRRLAEKQAEEERRDALLAAKEEERQRKKQERDRLAILKEEERIKKQQERERKKEDKLRKEEERRMQLKHKQEEEKKMAEEEYQRKLNVWNKQQQQQQIYYFQQQQQYYHLHQQQQIALSQQYRQHQQPPHHYLPTVQNTNHVIKVSNTIEKYSKINPTIITSNTNMKNDFGKVLDSNNFVISSTGVAITTPIEYDESLPKRIKCDNGNVKAHEITTAAECSATTTTNANPNGSTTAHFPSPEGIHHQSQLIHFEQPPLQQLPTTDRICYPTPTTVSASPYYPGADATNFASFTPHWHYSLIPPPPPPPPMPWNTRCSSKANDLLRRSKPKKISPPCKLCSPLLIPSPFANQNRYIVNVLLVRDPRSEQSFGVNLQLHTASVLVDSSLIEKKKVCNQVQRSEIQTDKKNETNENSNGRSKDPLCKIGRNNEDKCDEEIIYGTKQEEKNATSMMENAATCETSMESVLLMKKKRKRRRRMDFSVMLVTDADTQNKRRSDIDSEYQLRPGDIVIEIGGIKIEGMTFKDACDVFISKSERMNESRIEAKIVVAREKETVIPVKSNPKIESLILKSVSPKITLPVQLPPENSSMKFNLVEIFTLSNMIWKLLNSPNRALGLRVDIQDENWKKHATIFQSNTSTGLSLRSPIILQAKWLHLTRLLDYNLIEKGREYWKSKLHDEFGVGFEEIPFSSDVERSYMRSLPRPSNGCRCKRQDHNFLFDPKCTLFHDLQMRISKEELVELRKHRSKKNVITSSKNLNTVELAFEKRMIKLKSASENELIEARFVDRMEELQVKELRKAVFAPNLTTIVLSAIFELQREFPIIINDDEGMDGDEEDDDVPLVSLGNRYSADQNLCDIKKRPKHANLATPTISIVYLMRMLEYVSKIWGHVYREPDHENFAFRWELFQLHSNDNQWVSHSKNPRVPGSCPFENLQFGLSSSKSTRNEIASMVETYRRFEESIFSSSTPPDLTLLSSTVLDQFCLAVHLLSPGSSGLFDEMIALLKMGIFTVSSSGIPMLSYDWWSKIDIVVLDDMKHFWSSSVDPNSKHCINEELRDTLEEQWKQTDHGWVLAENPKEVIFDFTVLDEWRETFENRIEEKANLSEGIGRFGL